MKKHLLAALLGAAAINPAIAQSHNQWYGALDSGTLNMKNTNYPDPGSMSLSAGYRFSPSFALEGGGLFIGDSTIYTSTTSYTLRQGAVNIFAVGFLPIGQSIELFGKAGIGFHTARVTNNLSGVYNQYTTMNPLLGLGAKFNINSRFGLRLQWESLGKAKATESDPGADLSRLSIGGVLNF